MKTVSTILLLLAIQPVYAASDNFVARCEKMASEAKFNVVFADRPVSEDNSRSQEYLKALSRAGANSYHHVLGLTHAEPAVSLESIPHVLVDRDGSVCAVASVNLRLGFSVFEVLLARELTNPCQRAVVTRHEEEHVAVWRNHLRAGAQLMPIALRAKLGQATYFRNTSEAGTALPQRVNAAVAPLLEGLRDGISASHR